MDNFKKIVAENIINLRTASHMTQSQLGERLNYSDKSISKWERAESLPDAYVLKRMSELFGVSVDYLLGEHSSEEKKEVLAPVHRYSRKVITMIVILGIWAAVLLAFVILWLNNIVLLILFMYAIPVSLIVLLVLNSIWGKRKNNLYIISAIIWGIISSLYLSFINHNWWQLFLIGIPSQIIVILCFSIKKNSKNR